MKLKYKVMATTFLAGTCVYLLGETLSLEPSTAKASVVLESTNPIPQNPLTENIISPLGRGHYVALDSSPRAGQTSVTGSIGMFYDSAGVSGSSVSVKIGSTTYFSTTVNASGSFGGTLFPSYKLKERDVITVTVNFRDGYDLTETYIVSAAFMTPTIETEIREGVSVLTGKAEPKTEIEIKDTEAGTNIGYVKVPSSGIWTVDLTTTLRQGRYITVRASLDSNVSVREFIPVEAAINPTITSTLVNGSTTVSGMSAGGANVELWNDNVKIGTATADKFGNWSATVQPLLGGDKLVAKATLFDKMKESTAYTVSLSKLEQVSSVTTNSTKVKGKGAVGATVSVKESNKEIGTGVVDENGDFEITISKQTEGSKLSITQSRKGTTSVATEITVAKGLDKVSEISDVTTESTSLTGKGSPEATISVKAKGVEIGTARVTSTGEFTVNIAKQEEGTELFITQSKDGDESEVTKITVREVQLSAPIISTHYVGATYLTVEAPERAKKVMLRMDGKIIRTMDVTPSSQTLKFYVNDLPALKIPGTTFEFVAQDSQGRDGEVATGIVKEVPEPTLTTYKLGEVNITGRVGTDITRISLYNKDGLLLRNGQIEADGTFKILATNLPALQVVGDTFSVRATTASGAISEAVEGMVHPGILSAAPTIVDYYVTDSYMTGKVAPNAAKVLLRIDGRNIRIGTIATDGTFRIYTNDITALKEVGAQFEVVTQDAHNFYSEIAVGSTKFIEAPVVSPFRAGQSYINGTVSQGVTGVSVSDKSGTLLRYGQVYENGTFRIYVAGLNAFQNVGESFSVRAHNANGSRSEETKVTIQP
ncbi:Ig-like domain-containing protein [Listeria booriae]|uniref:Ig-like domain-containing protein n=1 Tax=Listeria booriae TaxID=1552123 RepID=UPI002880A308|nr:Ig-like domain-containing protein [Listeria booriae]MDT0112300.1 Ig-like domain-containing protein [Listeria booriae]